MTTKILSLETWIASGVMPRADHFGGVFMPQKRAAKMLQITPRRLRQMGEDKWWRPWYRTSEGYNVILISARIADRTDCDICLDDDWSDVAEYTLPAPKEGTARYLSEQHRDTIDELMKDFPEAAPARRRRR